MKKILVISDLHCGADTAICIPDFEVNSEREEIKTTVRANKVQEELFKQWQQMIDEHKRFDYVFNLADNIEGINRKGYGLGTIQSDLSWQTEMAIELLKMIPCRRHVGTQGSSYHVNSQASGDRAVIKTLSQIYHERFVFGDQVIFDVEDVKFHLRHVTPFTRQKVLSQSSLKRDILEALDEGKHTGRINCFLRGHTHRYAGLDYKPYFAGYVSPCWKISDQFIQQRSIQNPDIGYLIIEVNGSDFEVTPHILDIKQKY